jgi:prepilin-type N-terminal cleavage/methylation domain-containing protein/prepilin-type processing-associated H-X9-DG protein
MLQRTSSRAFTLIEILVVIAILGILAAILLPVFASARNAAKTSVCTSNVRQITMAALMYESDYDDTLCPPVLLTNLALYPWTAWFGELPSATSKLDPSRGLLAPYIKNVDVFNCPDIDVITDPNSEDLSYAINDQLCITTINLETFNTSFKTVNMSQVESPSETILFGDGAQNEPGPNIVTRSILQFNTHFAGSSRGFLHARHGGDVSIVSWLDGHVKAAHLSYNTRNDSSVYTAAWEEQVKIGDLLKSPRHYANPSGTAPSLGDMYYYLPIKERDDSAGHNSLTDWLLL